MNILRLCGIGIGISLAMMMTGGIMLFSQDIVRAIVDFVTWYLDMDLGRKLGFTGLVLFVLSLYVSFHLIMNGDSPHY